MPDSVPTQSESEWIAEAVHLWVRGRTVQQIADALDLTVDELAPVLAEQTYNAVDLALRGGGWK